MIYEADKVVVGILRLPIFSPVSYIITYSLWKRAKESNSLIDLRCTKIVTHPTVFIRLFGVNVVQSKSSLLWERKILGKYKRNGRNFMLSPEDMSFSI